ncbi:MAG: N-acetylmuramoyl-L-alanine amidase [Planctomycetota bacterium]|jgi:N-acetylmuramoyl-L-alanine amidase
MSADNPDWTWRPANPKAFGRGRPGDVTGGVNHFTAGGSVGALTKWIARTHDNPKQDAKATGHVNIGRKGSVIQSVRLADRAYHAGTSAKRNDFWMGEKAMTNVNDFTIGVECANYGKLTKSGRSFLNAYKKPYKGPAPIQAPDHKGVMCWWEPYPDELIESNIAVWRFIIEQYPLITRESLLSHSDVSPDRKFDPGPLFPWDYVLDSVFGAEAIIPATPTPVIDIYPEDEADEEIEHFSLTWGEDHVDEDPELHYDYDAQMSMIDRVRDPE